jgi:TPR repeat protein
MFKIRHKFATFPANIGCAVAIGCATVALPARDIDDGIVAYESGEYGKAFQILKHNAERGDSRAQYLLGTLYRIGKGVPPDEHDAFRWYKLAAEDGLLEAQYQIGMMYLQGEGVTSNDEEALKWLWKAASRGHPQAAETLEYVLYNDFTYGC